MPALQVKNLPADLHALFAARAANDGVTMAEYVTRLLRRDLERPTLTEWLEAHPASIEPRTIDISATLDEVRVEYAGDSPSPASRELALDVRVTPTPATAPARP